MSDQNAPLESLLGEYRRYRATVQLHLEAVLKFISIAARKEIVRRIGLQAGPETESEVTLAMDLAIFARKPGRSRTIDRYAQATSYLPGSVEATVLAALRAATFHLIRFDERHETAGWVVSDIVSGAKLWFMDEGLAATGRPGDGFATRLIELPPHYHATLGAAVPLSQGLAKQVFKSWEARRASYAHADIEDMRFQELLYATAIGQGAMHGIAYR